MIQLPVFNLENRPSSRLKLWQKEVDDLPRYEDRVAAGKTLFSARNTSRNATFNHIKIILSRMCQGARRCGYCEDSVADEVEHFYPKDLYPEYVFSWSNYLYACGPCNGPKNNQFAILNTDSVVVDVTRSKGGPITPPAIGTLALINPRVEDPMHFLFLDLLNTFTFSARIADNVSATDRVRAEYTIRVLRLNDRDYLVKARKTAFGTYRARLHEYVTKKQEGAPADELDRHRSELLSVGHFTVWREMQRQHLSYARLNELFRTAPEALAW